MDMRHKYVFLGVALLMFTGSAVAVASTLIGSATSTFSVSLSTEVASIAAGSSSTFSVTYRCASLSGDCTGDDIEITVPGPLAIETFTQSGGLLASSARTASGVRFTFVDPVPSGSSGTVTVTVRAPYCATTTQVIPATIALTAVASGSNSNPVWASSPAVPVAAIAGCVSDPFDTFQKWGYDIAPGGKIWWSMRLPKRATSYAVEDVLPPTMVLNEFGVGDSTIALEVFCGSLWYPISNWGLSDTPLVCPMSGQGPDALRFPTVTRVRALVPANTGSYLTVAMFSKSSLLPGTAVENCADLIAALPERSCVTSTMLKAAPVPDVQMWLVGSPNDPLASPPDWMPAPALAVDATHPMAAGDVAYAVRIRNGSDSGDDLRDPVISVLLDPALDVVAGATWEEAYPTVSGSTFAPGTDPRTQAGCLKPQSTVVRNFAGSGQTLVRWRFLNCVLAGGLGTDAGVGVYFSAHLASSTKAGTNVQNHAAVSTFELGSRAASWNCWNALVDTNDVDADGYTDDELCLSSDVNYTVPTRDELTSNALIQGTLDSELTRYPAFGETDQTGTATYEFTIKNSGSGSVAALDVVDLLPAVGDTSVLPPMEARNSGWGQQVVSVDSVAIIDTVGVATVVPAADVALGYSNLTNPCRLDSGGASGVRISGGVFPALATVTGPAGCTPGDWDATPVGARSIALSYRPAVAFAPGQTLRIRLKVALIGAPVAGTVAWNSYAFSARPSDSSSFDLSAEPRRSGVTMVDRTTTAALSGWVWHDKDSNGLRDDTSSALAGVQVTVLDTGGTVVTTRLTTTDGSWAAYGLAPNSQYSVVFGPVGLPLELVPTLPDVGADELVDSDVPLSSAPYRLVSVATGSPGSETRGNNLGLNRLHPPT